jgi:hypothetical protein
MTVEQIFRVRGLTYQGPPIDPSPDQLVSVQLIRDSTLPYGSTILLTQREVDALHLTIGDKIKVFISKTD